MIKGQMKLDLFKGQHGGRRLGAGRKRLHSPGVAHRTREKVKSRYPLHINFKVRLQIRNKQALSLLKRAIINARGQGLRIIHFSLQSNHVHLIVEAADNALLTKGMRSLTITFAKGLKKGRIQMERYHLHVLKSLKEAHNAVKYVLLNQQKHSGQKVLKLDEYSSLFFLGYEFSKQLVKKEKLALVWTLDSESKTFWMRPAVGC